MRNSGNVRAKGEGLREWSLRSNEQNKTPAEWRKVRREGATGYATSLKSTSRRALRHGCHCGENIGTRMFCVKNLKKSCMRPSVNISQRRIKNGRGMVSALSCFIISVHSQLCKASVSTTRLHGSLPQNFLLTFARVCHTRGGAFNRRSKRLHTCLISRVLFS